MSKAKPGAKAPEEKEDTKGSANVPENKLNNLRDNSVTASEMSEMRGGKPSKLAASADDVATFEAEDEKRAEDEDNSDHGRLSRSGYVLNDDQNTGRRWVGVPWQNDAAEKDKDHIVRVTPIQEVVPFTGLTVRPKGGDPFALPELPKDATPAYWLGLLIPGTKKNFITA